MHGSVAEHFYNMGCLNGRRGVELDEPNQCQHVDGCENEGTILCDCGELICKEHVSVCAEEGCEMHLCTACAMTSVDDQQVRCMNCHQAHKEEMNLTEGKVA